LLLVGTACSKQETAVSQDEAEVTQKVLKVAWWGNDGRRERTLEVIRLFEQQYPHIKIEPTDAPNSDYWTQLAMNAADQNMPDVYQMDYKFIDEYAKRRLLLPLDELAASGKLNISNLDESSLASGQIDNRLYGIVTGINAPSMVYNPEIFAQTGVALPAEGYTYEDFVRTARELKQKIGNPEFIPLGSGALDFSYYLRQRGASFYSVDGQSLGYDDNQILSDFFKLEKQLIDEGLMASPDSLKTRSSDKDSLLVNKLAAFQTMASNNVVSSSKLMNQPLRLIPLPVFKGGKEGNYVKPSMYFSISAYTKVADEAALFVDFFFNNLEANDVLMGERGVPASSKVREHLLGAMEENDKEQYKYMEYVDKHASPIDPPVPLTSTSVNTLFTKVRNQMLSGQITPDEAAQQFRDGAEEIFAEALS
jgi:multiple sugar transport system substrate-binding protein